MQNESSYVGTSERSELISNIFMKRTEYESEAVLLS